MSVTELVAAAVKYCYDNEVGVPAAANAVWDQMRATTDDATVGELARDGLTVRVQRAVSDDRYLKGPRMIDPAPTPTYREVRIVRPATPSDSQSDAPSPVRVVQFRILEVRYTGRDGNVYPLRKFIRTDVEAVIERLSSDINGKTVVRNWFDRVLHAMDSNGMDRVGDLPEHVLKELSIQAPFSDD